MPRIKMNCRLQSDTQELGRMFREIGITPDICHVPGLPMGTKGPAAKRIARTHYATILKEDGTDTEDVSRWLDGAIGTLNAHSVLHDGIADGRIQAFLWIAILPPPSASPAISIAPRFVDAVATLGATIFLEDYNKTDEDGIFDKQWFP